MSKISLSPTLFLVLETFILAPSIIFLLGVLQFVIFNDPFLLTIVTPRGATLQNIFVTIISPFIGGFFAYQYLERFKPASQSSFSSKSNPKRYVFMVAKGIIFYSIMLVGLVIIYNFFENVL